MSRRLGIVAFVVSGALLLTMGGAIFAAPVIVPMMIVAVRSHPTRAFRAVGGVLVALTVGEVAWLAVYVMLGEVHPWIWLLPVLVGVSAGAATARRQPTTIGTFA
jgi:hypothetical protein